MYGNTLQTGGAATLAVTGAVINGSYLAAAGVLVVSGLLMVRYAWRTRVAETLDA